MNERKELAPAKLNLTLDILRRRKDGYHDLQMVMTTISLCDRVTVRLRSDGRITAAAPGTGLPEGESNLAGRAARVFFDLLGECPGAEIVIEKRIPTQAGMGGGSADAAAVLRALRAMLCPKISVEMLEVLGAQVGSDVPFCVRGGTALVEGRGERLTCWPALPPCYIVVCKPEFGLSTPALFGRVAVDAIQRRPDLIAMDEALYAGDLLRVGRQMVNVFEEVLTPKEAAVFAIRKTLVEAGALGAVMTGSGPTVFGLFSAVAAAQNACDLLRVRYPQTYLTEPKVEKLV